MLCVRIRGSPWGRFWGAPWVQFADRLGEQKCCVFTLYRGLGGVTQEHAKGRKSVQPETSLALIDISKTQGKATALGHASRAQGTVAKNLVGASMTRVLALFLF